MQAVRIHEYGAPSQLTYETVPEPAAGPGEVLVELRAAAVNRRDTLIRSGFLQFELPLVLGSDGAGVRRDTGEEVVVLPGLRWGAREDAPGEGFGILGGPEDGTYAELVTVPAENAYPKPARLSWEEAAALPVAGLTAYRGLFTRARLEAGETVLVLGAGSGVATFAVSLARQAGANVLVTSSSAEKIERARELGADGGVDYTDADWPEAARELAGGGVDVVVDSVGATWPDSLRCLRPGGRVVAFGATGGTTAELPVRPFYLAQLSLLGTTLGSPRDFERLLAAIEGGGWSPVVDSVRPLAEAVAAHERMEDGEHFGKLVLAV
ncbi:MAG TPA: zinc-binding dehydrogenase [Gaiellaceae bacterium]|nr:zinc-binding dehydrogenase [Gaiellaceae bacterium]